MMFQLLISPVDVGDVGGSINFLKFLKFLIEKEIFKGTTFPENFCEIWRWPQTQLELPHFEVPVHKPVHGLGELADSLGGTEHEHTIGIVCSRVVYCIYYSLA